MVLNIIYLLLALSVLVYASRVFVDASSSIANHFKVSKMLIALTIASFGTCVPELAISFNSFASLNGDMALANVLGSCIVNILLVIGLACCVGTIKIKKETVKKQLPILVIITSFFSFTIIYNLLIGKAQLLSRASGLILFLLFIVFLIYLFLYAREHRGIEFKTNPKYPMVKSIIYTIACIIIIVLSSDVVVDMAVNIANHFNVSQKVITMTIIVIGSSLPELITTITASRKKEYELAVGNIIGTNIFNLGIVLGLPTLMYGGVISSSYNIIDAIIVEVAVIMLYLFCKSEHKLTKIEGVLMIIIFVLYYTVMLMT